MSIPRRARPPKYVPDKNVLDAKAALKAIDDRMAIWLKDPKVFMREVLSLELTRQQCGLCDEVGKLCYAKLKMRERGVKSLTPEELKYAKKRGISIRAGKGLGKDFIGAALILWMLVVQADPGMNTKVATLAPTKDALKTVLWSEINMLYGQCHTSGPLKGQTKFMPYLKERIVVEAERIYNKTMPQGKDTCYAFQRTVKKSADKTETTTSLGGLHAQNLMVLIDEATAVDDAVFEGLISTLTDPNNWALLIFNPTTTSGYAARTHLDSELGEHWITLHWDARQCERIGDEYLASMRHKYGEGSNQWKAFVTGEFPIDNDGALVNMQWIHEAKNKLVQFVHRKEKTICGIDVGAGGSDPTVICQRRGGKIVEFHRVFRDEPDDIAEEVARYCLDERAKELYVDTIGAGEYMPALLRQRFDHVVGIKASNQAYQHDKFHRRRDELLWNVRERFRKREISIPRNEFLQEELEAIKYDEGILTGKIKVESKESLRARLGRSIDYVDALALALYTSDYIGDLKIRQGDSDPYRTDDDDWMTGVVSEYSWMEV